MFAAIDPHQIQEAASHVTAHDILEPAPEQPGVAVINPKLHELCDRVDRFLDAIRNEHRDDPEAFWQWFQNQWSWAQQDNPVTPMNAVNLCPEPKVLIEAANALRLEYNVNPSQQERTKRGLRVRQLEASRKALAAGLNIKDVTELAIIRNASEGNNAINCGFRGWRGGDDPRTRENVVIWRENHPTNNEAWWLRAQWGQASGQRLFDVRAVDFFVDESEAEIARAFISQIDDRTRFVTLTEVSNGNGMRIPEGVIRRIWNHIQDNRLDCHFHIDGTMSFGSRPVNLHKPHCHSFISSAHKWFIGPKETGVLWMDKSKVQNFMPSIFAYDYKITVGKWEDMPNSALRFELIGQRDDVNIICLALTQCMWTALAPRKPYERVAALSQRLMKRLQADEWDLITPPGPERSWGIVRVNARQDKHEKTLYDYMYEAHGIGGSGDELTFRLSPHVYNTMADIERAADAMKEWRDGNGT